jgi:hypothetical protein
VVFIESSDRVTENFESEVVNDVLDAFGWDRGAFRPDGIRNNNGWSLETNQTNLLIEISKSPRNWRSEV